MKGILLLASFLWLAGGCSRERATARAGIAARANVCFAYRASSEYEGAAADQLVSMVPSESAIVEYRGAVEGSDPAKTAEIDKWAAKLRPGTKLRKLRRGDGWVKVLVVGSPDGNVAGYVLASQCNALPPRGIVAR